MSDDEDDDFVTQYVTNIDPSGADNQPSLIGCVIIVAVIVAVLAFIVAAVL